MFGDQKPHPMGEDSTEVTATAKENISRYDRPGNE